MKALNLIIVLLLTGMGLSCVKKKYPAPEVIQNTATYYSKLTINNSPILLEAGVNGYYMYSSYKLDSNSIYNFVADLKQIDCTNCPNSLKVQINDYQTSSGTDTRIDSSLRIAKYPYLSGNLSLSYSQQFYSLTTANSYTWDFGDGTTSHEMNPVKTFNKPGKYAVCLTTNAQGCMSSICNKEKIDLSSKSCKTHIYTTGANGNSIHFNTITTSGKSPYQYFWNFGDGTTSTDATPICNYKYRGAYAVTLRVVDFYGDTATANYNAKTITDNSSCAANYSVSSITATLNKDIFSRILISWTDADGTIYTSNNSLQPSDAYFEILSVDDAQNNENGQKTKKIVAKFKCTVYNGSRSIRIDDAEVVLSVAYK